MDGKLYAGIDPGQTGGLGIIDQAGEFIAAHRWSKKDPRELYNILYNYKDMLVMVYLENINLPQTGAGIENKFCGSGNLLVNAGIWQGWLIALDLPYLEIAPATWQAAAGLWRWQSKISQPRPAGAPVPHSPLSLARLQWPQAPLEHKIDDGKAVALHLAQLARQDAWKGIDRGQIQARAQEKKKAKRALARAQNPKNTPGSDMPW